MESFVNLLQPLPDDVGINLGRRDLGVPQHHLDRPQVGSPLEEMGREGMPQDVRRNVLSNALPWRRNP